MVYVIEKIKNEIRIVIISILTWFLARFIKEKKKWIEYYSNISVRQYNTYEEYLKHQKLKLESISDVNSYLKSYDIKYHQELKRRLKEEKIIQPGMNVLCLAARIGTEVRSFLDIGCFAVGLDLNPGIENKYVVFGDFHDIQYPDNCVDVIFSNSIDHTFDINLLIKEIKRVLKPNGFLILEIVKGTEEEHSPDSYEVITWKKIDDLVDKFLKSGFKLVKEKSDFEYPWKGQHVSLTLNP